MGVWSPSHWTTRDVPREHFSFHFKEMMEVLRLPRWGRVGTGDAMMTRALRDRGSEQGGSEQLLQQLRRKMLWSLLKM